MSALLLRCFRGLSMAVALLVTSGWMGACLDRDPLAGPQGIDDNTTRVLAPDPFVSNRISPIASVRITASAASAAATDVVYVSLRPETVPEGGLAIITNRRSGVEVSAAMADGGFDPVPIAASFGDTLEVRVSLAGGGSRFLTLLVPAVRKPIVVRTDPPPRKRDVPLNTAIVVVFSEPIDPGTVGNVRLRQGSTPVSAGVALTPDGLRATLQVDPPLAPNTDYVISIPTTVVDLSGDHVEQAMLLEFTTGTTSITASVATDPVAMFTSPFGNELRTFAMRATRDSDGNVAGTFSVFYPEIGVRQFGRVTCFTIVDGKAAWIGGVVEGANDTTWLGMEVGWRAADNGTAGSTVADQLSFAYPLEPGTLTAQAFCRDTPLTDHDPSTGSDDPILLYDLISGDVAVNATGAPPPPPPPPGAGGMSEIAFAVWPDGGIQVIRADGIGGRVLTGSGDWNPAWSPDALRIAFHREDPSGSDIYVINADGSGLRRLTSGPEQDLQPTWSPDGTKIAFGRNGAIYTMNASDGSQLTLLTAAGYNFHASWSPDGSRIAFASSRGGWNAIYVMNADGSNVRQITNAPIQDYHPSWSPDGRMIAFQRGESGVGSIYLVGPDGTGLTQLTLVGRTPSWSPDSRVVVFEQYGLTVVNDDGSGMRRLGIGFDPAWSSVGSMPPRIEPTVSLEILGGNGQAGTVGATLAQPLTVKATHDDGTPAVGVKISWYLLDGGLPGGPNLSEYNATTDDSGISSVHLTLGETPGQLSIRAAVTDGSGRTPGVEFTATALPGPP